MARLRTPAPTAATCARARILYPHTPLKIPLPDTAQARVREHRLRHLRQVLFAALIVAVICVACGSDRSDTVSIEAARHLPPGTAVTVKGFVTVPPNLFASFTGEQGFAVEDATGGIYVALESRANFPLGKEIRVTGQLADIAKLLTVASRVEQVEPLTRQLVVQPALVTTGAVGATTEGRLVRVQGPITRPIGDDRPYGYKIFLDDGSGETQVFVPVSTGIDPFALPGLRVGQRLAAVGFSGRFNETYEVIPRFAADLTVAAP
ncbi:MAG TPA: DNA-binding protein [Candidatus Binatia bacterium]|nr:DNA-binding protein [Candidatus Binatia bacterium]